MAHNVHPQMWDDAKFLSFDDTTRILWVCLLTGPQRRSLPGLFRASVMDLADTLHRPPELIENSMKLLEREDMVEHDRLARVVCLPNAPKWASRPHPNQLVAWFAQWRDLPICELKYAHIPRLEALVDPKHARKPVVNAWAKTFGDPRNLERRGWVELGDEPLPHTPSPDPRSTIDLQKGLKREAIRMAGSESANVRKKERYDSGNSDTNRKTQNARGLGTNTGSGVGDGGVSPNENESLRLDNSTPNQGVVQFNATEDPSAGSVQNTPSEPRSNGQDPNKSTTSSVRIRKNEKSEESSRSIGGDKTQPAETPRDRQTAPKNQASKIHHRDALPEWCLPKTRRKRTPTSP